MVTKAELHSTAPCSQQQHGAPAPHLQRPPCHQQPPQAPRISGSSSMSSDQQQALRVTRTPLKHRAPGRSSTGLSSRGLSRNYSGKSQSFCCIQDLTRNPWAAETALALAKRPPAMPLPVPGASPFAAAGSHPFQPSPCHPLSWSIDEEEECLLGGITCSARLTAASSCGGGSCGDSSCGTLTAACSDSVEDDMIDEDEAEASAFAAAQLVSTGGCNPQQWASSSVFMRNLQHKGMLTQHTAALTQSTNPWDAAAAGAAWAADPLPLQLQHAGGDSAHQCAELALGGSCMGAPVASPPADDDLCVALRGARLTMHHHDLWMVSGAADFVGST